MQHQRLELEGGAGKLEAIYQPGCADQPAVVLCHPHPLYGGTMRNKVVYWIARALNEAGYGVLRFNFRGVEGSEGSWDEGKGESDDARSALNWLAQQSHNELWMAGFSFGCYAGLRAAADDVRVSRMIAVAPAVHMHDFSFMQRRKNMAPCAIIAAEKDEIVPFDALSQWAMHCPEHQWFCIPEATHFFPQHQSALQDGIRQCISEAAGKKRVS